LQDQQQRRGRRRGRRGGRGRRGNGGGNGGGGTRPPREGQFSPRYDQPRGDWNREYNPPQAAAPAAVPIPTSIHEIDTTPRDPSPPRQDFGSHSSSHSSVSIHETSVAARTHAVSAPYEVVEQASEKPKGGWWKKLTGQ
jgi:hypothetical protein